MRLKYLWLTLIFALMFFFLGCTAVQAKSAQAEKGILNLTDWDMEKDGNIKLDGEWEFYWNRLLTHKDLGKQKPDLYADIPSTWNTYSLKGKNLPGQGYATYRLHVRTSLPAGTMIGLRLYTFSSAYKLFINDRLIASNGRVSENAEKEIGEYKPQAVFFTNPASEFDIIIQVSNSHYARGGFWYTVSMGSVEGIIDHHDNLMAKEAFLLGALLIISLFYFAIYILRKELKYTLYFAFLCLVMAIGIDMVGQLIIPRFFQSLSFNAVIFLWYSSATWVVFCLILFVHELYPSKVSGAIVKVYLGMSVILQLLYIFTPPVFYTKTGLITNYVEIAGYLCTVIIVAIGIKKGNKSGWLNIISMFVALITYLHDVFYWTNVIRHDFGEIFYVGLFLFIFIQMVIQAQRIKLFHEYTIAAELAFLQAQIKPHFLYNALNTFVSISHYDMDKARNLLTDFSNYLRRSFDFKDLSQFVPLKNEIELAKSYVEIEKARFEERIEVNFQVPEELEVRVPILMLQPLIENAVIHGILPKPEGGRVDISVEKEGKMLIFTVRDNGIGMAMEELNRKLKHDTGKGVGLANIDTRLRKLFGKGLNIKSSSQLGTEITWSVPVNY